MDDASGCEEKQAREQTTAKGAERQHRVRLHVFDVRLWCVHAGEARVKQEQSVPDWA